MKTIIAGSRSITDYSKVKKAIEKAGFDITEVISGTAIGVDKLGEKYAEENNIPIKQFPAQWKTFGKMAGTYRNEQMAEYADALIAVWDGVSFGTKDMIKLGLLWKLKVFIYDLRDEDGKSKTKN